MWEYVETDRLVRKAGKTFTTWRPWLSIKPSANLAGLLALPCRIAEFSCVPPHNEEEKQQTQMNYQQPILNFLTTIFDKWSIFTHDLPKGPPASPSSKAGGARSQRSSHSRNLSVPKVAMRKSRTLMTFGLKSGWVRMIPDDSWWFWLFILSWKWMRNQEMRKENWMIFHFKCKIMRKQFDDWRD